ncbi:hypothetical protein P280DRAFT_468823 [Massarina eburnea CBS 473.64]|uniref:Glycosyltransferase family 31 protein n=1 Tax=Massarina eburnea CBS 473.64 TaxID=1395130 RepID=A0A6A6S0P6_9PLEO|nr:hypothetical protein P280DRAFT_468823 [Massarina eburnea CBS 473.64]
MPLLTPSRILCAVLSFLLMGFLWTYGMPQQHLTHQLPIINHGGENLIPHLSAGKPAPPGAAGPSTPPTDVAPMSTKAASTTPNTTCKDVRGAADVMVVVRTSKAELSAGLPKQLKTLLSCAPNVAIFSDHAGTVDGFPVYDALESISPYRITKYDEFREYEKIKADTEYKSSLKDAEALDKWKFLPMVYDAYQKAPSHRFYMFLEADTSLTWTNLLQWLDRLDYRIQYYTGAPVTTQNDMQVVQQSPGILLSWGALRAYSKMYRERYAEEWESYVGKECCGDVMLATAMSESHVELVSSWPLLQGEAPSTLDWTERHWCAPIVSWHHMNSAEAELFKTTQEKWSVKHGWATPYLARDAFEELVLPQLGEKKTDWDNISSDTVIKAEPGRKEKEAKDKAEQERKKDEEKKSREAEKSTESTLPPPPKAAPHARRDTADDWEQLGHAIKEAANSIENCQSICNSSKDCLQWRYTPNNDGECHLGKVLLLGKKVEKGGQEWTSGWNMDRINKVTKDWKPCDEADWRFNQQSA